MSNDDTYNGYASYKTWLAYTWLGNDEGSYETAREQAAHGADSLQCFIEEIVEEQLIGDAGLHVDLMSAALSRVDFDKLAESFAE